MQGLNLLLAQALRSLRDTTGLSRAELCRRTREDTWPLHPVSRGQLSRFESGAASPNLLNLVSLLVVCSPGGGTLDFNHLQEALLVEVRKSARELVWLQFGEPRGGGPADLLQQAPSWHGLTEPLDLRVTELERRVRSLEHKVVGQVMGWGKPAAEDYSDR